MNRLARPALCLCLIAAWAGSARTRAGTPSPVTDSLAPVEITGERPGPQMWKLSRGGDHVVWILGILQPLPRKMTWRSKAVEDVLDQAQEVVPYNFSYDADIGLLSMVRLYFEWRHVRVLPRGQTLRQVLPPPLYARFAALSRRYAHSETRFERLQPALAGAELRQLALAAAGLSTSADVRKSVLKLARRHEVKIRKLQLEIADPRAVLQEAGDVPVAAQLQCLTPMIDALESDTEILRRRADAWAEGDVAALRALPVPDTQQNCLGAVAGAPRIRQLADQAHKLWTGAVEEALISNRTTLALQDIGRLLGPQGWLAEFRAAGYQIEGPAYTSR